MKQRWVLAVMLMSSVFCFGLWAEGRAWAQTEACAGDCNHNDRVTVDELVAAVSMVLHTLPVDHCPDLDPDGSQDVSIDELLAAVSNALDGCNSRVNHAPQASGVSFGAGPATPYVEKQLIGSDPDNDTITYELIADETGTGYEFAYVNPESGMLYLTLAPDFQGTIVLPYRVSDGKRFSNTANATVDVAAITPVTYGGVVDIDPREYASYPRGFYNGSLLGAPGANPTLPSSVDLTKDYPLPGAQGKLNSCVGWALGYAMKSYQERVELGWSLEPLEHRFSPAYIYNQLNGGQNVPIHFNQALDLVVDQGVASLAEMPYDDQDVWTQPSAAARAEASQFRANSWKAANGVLEIKDALANHLAVMVVIQMLDQLYDLRGPDSVYNTFSGNRHGSHAVTAIGYDDDRYGGAFRILNSWNRSWGDGGYFWLPYAAANYIVIDPGYGPVAVLSAAAVLEDAPDPNAPPPDPYDPPPTGDLPDLQVTNWHTNFDGKPGGSGSLQYTVTNTGIATAPAGAYVALVVSHDPTFKSGNILVVYEQIPFEMAPGTTAYRDENNTIAFNFPSDLQPGQYYMATWVDIWDNVAEWNEDDNVSPGTSMIDIVNTLPDMEVNTWYASWDELGLGSLTYEVINNGASVAPAGWQVTLALSPNNIFGDGDETYLFSEPANFDVYPGGTLYRDDWSAAGFSLYFDTDGNQVPDGIYYIALWLDPYASLAESNEYNNASLSWGTVGIGVAGVAAGTGPSAADTTSVAPAKAYNGKVLPERRGAERKVRISTASQGHRQMEFVGEGAGDDGGPRLKAADSPRWSKTARARQQVIFPVSEMKAMPGGD